MKILVSGGTTFVSKFTAEYFLKKKIMKCMLLTETAERN